MNIDRRFEDKNVIAYRIDDNWFSENYGIPLYTLIHIIDESHIVLEEDFESEAEAHVWCDLRGIEVMCDVDYKELIHED